MKFGQIIEYNNKNTFFSKIIQKMRQEDQFQTSFCCFKKLYMRLKEVVCSLLSGPQLCILWKQTV